MSPVVGGVWGIMATKRVEAAGVLHTYSGCAAILSVPLPCQEHSQSQLECYPSDASLLGPTGSADAPAGCSTQFGLTYDDHVRRTSRPVWP